MPLASRASRIASRVAIVCGLASFFTGCSTESTTPTTSSPDVEDPRPPTSPENVLENIALSYRHLDVGLYADQFAPSFEQRPPDAARDVWNHETDVDAMSHLFELVEWITFELEYESPVGSTTEGYPADEGFWQVPVHSVNIRIQPEAMDVTLSVTNEHSLFVLAEDTSTNPSTWRVVCQQMFWPPGETARVAWDVPVSWYCLKLCTQVPDPRPCWARCGDKP